MLSKAKLFGQIDKFSSGMGSKTFMGVPCFSGVQTIFNIFGGTSQFLVFLEMAESIARIFRGEGGGKAFCLYLGGVMKELAKNAQNAVQNRLHSSF